MTELALDVPPVGGVNCILNFEPVASIVTADVDIFVSLWAVITF